MTAWKPGYPAHGREISVATPPPPPSSRPSPSRRLLPAVLVCLARACLVGGGGRCDLTLRVQSARGARLARLARFSRCSRVLLASRQASRRARQGRWDRACLSVGLKLCGAAGLLLCAAGAGLSIVGGRKRPRRPCAGAPVPLEPGRSECPTHDAQDAQKPIELRLRVLRRLPFDTERSDGQDERPDQSARWLSRGDVRSLPPYARCAARLGGSASVPAHVLLQWQVFAAGVSAWGVLPRCVRRALDVGGLERSLALAHRETFCCPAVFGGMLGLGRATWAANEGPPFSCFCTRTTTCFYPDRAATGLHFVPGLPHAAAHSQARGRSRRRTSAACARGAARASDTAASSSTACGSSCSWTARPRRRLCWS